MDIICFSHLRWNFVYQRPQHLLSRFAKDNRVFFFEEPVYDASSPHYTLIQDEATKTLVVTPHLPEGIDTTIALRELVDQLITVEHVNPAIAWYYSPMSFAFSSHLTPGIIVYDCMDELSAFRFAPPALKQYESMLFNKADIVFTGGHHLYEAKQYLHDNIHPFPSSIDKAHFEQARKALPEPADQANIPHPRIGFYGVVDERFNISLLKDVAALHPEWHFVIVGPVVKIDPATLPVANNIHYIGGRSYNDLPSYLSGWDVAMMPFALNESTKYISPTKTPEFLAGGKPVVSTSIRDVVIPYGRDGLVEIADTVNEFSEAIHLLLHAKNDKEWLEKTDKFLANISWDKTFSEMLGLINETIERKKNNNNKQNKQEAYV
jgi:hypothetical protein